MFQKDSFVHYAQKISPAFYCIKFTCKKWFSVDNVDNFVQKSKNRPFQNVDCG